MVKLDRFPFCCGITVMGNLSDPSYPPKGYAPEPYDAAYDRALGTRRWFMPPGTVMADPNNLPVLATTVPAQKEAIAELEKRGFVRLATLPGQHGEYRTTLWGLGMEKVK